jgi:HPt (histidine-containing phosphotransfer) domain-containing protein
MLAAILNSNPQPIRQLIAEAHKIRGTAGAYGFKDVSDAMGRIEDILVGKNENELSPNSLVWETVKEALQQAEHAVTRR